ncbi:MAG: peroxiredoxin family protein, partial [Chloroflexi bacterium]|nr:peroxiredoxin family protein [Chloroflexota bacterium]
MERIALFGGLVALALIALQGWFLLQLFQQHGRLLVRLDALEAQLASGGRVPVPPAPPRREVGLKVGTLAPAFELPDLQGTRFSLNTLRAPGRPLLLVFSNPGCGPCTSLMPDLARWQKEFADRLLHAYLRSGVKVQCFDIAPTNGHAPLAETLTTFSPFMDPTIIVNRNAFCDYDDARQLATLFHESMHLDVPYHDPDQRLADNNTDVDRFYACALLCFAREHTVL